MYRGDLQEYKFCELYKEKPKKNKVETNELYPKYQSGGIIGEFNYYEYDNKYILFGRKGCVGNPQKINGKFSINENVFVYDINEGMVVYNYMYHHLKYITNYDKYIVGATMPGISYSNMSKYKLVIPPIEIQKLTLEKIEPKESLIQELEKNIKCAEQEAKDIMQVLFN
jgi:restriction endonuclease S subunit